MSSQEIEVRIEFLDDNKLAPKTLKLDSDCLIEDIIEFLKSNFTIKEELFLYLDFNKTKIAQPNHSLEQLKLKQKSTLYACRSTLKKTSEVFIQNKIEGLKNNQQSPDEIEIKMITYIDGQKFKTLALTSDSTTEDIIEVIRDTDKSKLSKQFEVEYKTSKKQYQFFDHSISLFDLGIKEKCDCDMNIKNQKTDILSPIPKVSNEKASRQNLANQQLINPLNEQIQTQPQMQTNFTQSIYGQNSPINFKMVTSQEPNFYAQQKQENQNFVINPAIQKPYQTVTQLFAQENNFQNQQSEIFVPLRDTRNTNQLNVNEDDEFIPFNFRQQQELFNKVLPHQGNSIEQEHPEAPFVPVFQKSIDSYFVNILMNERQIAIISEDSEYVCFQSCNQTVKTILFKQDSVQQMPQIKNIDVEKSLIYNDVCVVFLKEKLGLIVIWKGDRSISRFFRIQE